MLFTRQMSLCTTYITTLISRANSADKITANNFLFLVDIKSIELLLELNMIEFAIQMPGPCIKKFYYFH